MSAVFKQGLIFFQIFQLFQFVLIHADLPVAQQAHLLHLEQLRRGVRGFFQTHLERPGQQILIDDAVVLVDGYYKSSMIYSKNVGYAHIPTADYYWLTTEIVPAE